MDHWGDPWADDADTKSPPKEEVKTPAPTLSAGSGFLHPFLDDAPWASAQEEDSEGWGIYASLTDSEHKTASETRVTDPSPTLTAINHPYTTTADGPQENGALDLMNEGWGSSEDDQGTSKVTENVLSEASDSATTIQPDGTAERTSLDFSEELHPDDDLSTRPSTSPSDVSQIEGPTESPRTSFEEEGDTRKSPELDTAPIRGSSTEPGEEIGPRPDLKTAASGSSGSDDFGDFEDDRQVEIQSSIPAEVQAQELFEPPPLETGNVATDLEPNALADIPDFSLDISLMTQLFPPAKPSEELSPAPDDPIYSTSARKSWYRLTRKQTMREFNSGGDENNYVRVTWATSEIRLAVSKIVGRWATEDRMSGRGGSGGATFYWDQPHAPVPKTSSVHARKKSMISDSSPTQPAKQDVPTLLTNAPAAFSWSSSPLPSDDPWRQDGQGTRLTSSPIMIKNNDIAKVQRQAGRSVSVDLTSRSPMQASHKRANTLEGNLSAVPSDTGYTSQSPASVDPWADLDSLDTTTQANAINNTIEDDDDWGEMVESPAVSITTSVEKVSQNSNRDQTLSTPSSIPKSMKSSPFQPSPTRHASPIVRLKGTVSPTSALFGSNGFIPVNMEQGPIGPGILKPAAKSRDQTPEKPHSSPAPMPSIQGILDEELTEPAANVEQFDESYAFETSPTPPTTEKTSNLKVTPSEDLFAFESSIPEREPARPPTPTLIPSEDFSAFEASTSQPELTHSIVSTIPPSDDFTNMPSAPEHSSSDPWAEADFSFFDSAPPPPSNLIPQHQPDPSDPFSIFSTPAPAPAPLTRAVSPPKEPPPKMPLTSASTSTQRRKAEEDEMIRAIVEGLPDLRYMLHR